MKQWVRNTAITIILIITATLAYSGGNVHGFLAGLSEFSKDYCEELNLTKINEICIIKNNTTYNMTITCQGMKFGTIGKKEMGKIAKIAYTPQKIICYPITGCW